MTQPPIKTLLARQGIYDKKGSVYAYELLYRNHDELSSSINHLNPVHGDAATSSVITQIFTNLDLNSVIGTKRAFINFTYNNLIEKIPHLLPRNRIVIEVLETVTVDKLLLDNLKQLKEDGYKIALDDFIYRKELEPLIALADIIKIDVLHLSKQQMLTQLKPLKELFNQKLLAEKIEDKQQFNTCIDLGFDYFQGFFLNKPDPFKGQQLSENKSHLLQLIAEINNDSVPLQQIEDNILQIPKLSYRILRLANSASMYSGRKIDSLMDAINQLGLVQIRNWISLLLLSSMDDLAPDLLELTLIRAKMCESLAKVTGYPNPHQAYTAGILSTLDGILNEPMTSLLSKIQLSETLNEALLDHAGELGALLKFTINYEQANFNQLANITLDEQELTRSYLQAIEHAHHILHVIDQ